MVEVIKSDFLNVCKKYTYSIIKIFKKYFLKYFSRHKKFQFFTRNFKTPPRKKNIFLNFLAKTCGVTKFLHNFRFYWYFFTSLSFQIYICKQFILPNNEFRNDTHYLVMRKTILQLCNFLENNTLFSDEFIFFTLPFVDKPSHTAPKFVLDWNTINDVNEL